MVGKYPAEKLRMYPHLMVGDIAIWDRFLALEDHGFDSFDYDVHVGEGIIPSAEWTPEIQAMALALSEKRIDVVGWVHDVPTIIEVKPSASLSAIGQVLCYRELYSTRFPGVVRPFLMIVTDFELPDIRKLCSVFGISFVLVGGVV
jgi:hypothetical protein